MIDRKNLISNLNENKYETVLYATREIKNAVIGNKTNKNLFIEAGVIEKLVHILTNNTDSKLLIQAAAALGSLSCGVPENVSFLVQGNAIEALLQILASPDAKVIETATRSLKIIYESAEAPRGLLFQGDTIPRLIAQLSYPSDVVKEVSASLLAKSCLESSHQNSVAQENGIGALIELLFSSYSKSQEAALDALAALCDNNANHARIVRDHEHGISQIFKLVKDKRPSLRLLAIKCICNIYKTKVIDDKVSSITSSVLPTLVKLFQEESDISCEALSILGKLVEDNEDLQKVACEADAPAKLGSFLRNAVSNPSAATHRMQKSALKALAALASLREENRKAIIDAKLLTIISQSLESDSIDVRGAACLCIRSLSRGTKDLRSSLVDAKICAPLFRRIEDEDDPRIQRKACAAICNLALEFDSVKEELAEHGYLGHLAAFTHSMDHQLRMVSLWTLKSYAYRASTELKEKLIEKLSYTELMNLLQEEEEEEGGGGGDGDGDGDGGNGGEGNDRIREQAFAIMRNLALGDSEYLSRLLSECGRSLLHLAENALRRNPDPRILRQVLYTLVNMAVGDEGTKRELMTESLLEPVYGMLENKSEEVRVAAVWLLINLSWTEDAGARERVQRLKELGFADRLQRMKETESSAQVKERIATVLAQFDV